MIVWVPRLIIIFTAFFSLGPPSFAQGTDVPWQNWQTQIDAGHPHVGRIWSVTNEAFVTPEDLVHALVEADFRLLGETHDNPDHHRLQAWLTSEIAASGNHPAIVFEMIDRSQETALKTYMDQADANAVGLGMALGWDERGWPDWSLYQPIAEVAFAYDLPIAFGNESLETVRAAATQGLDVLDAEKRVMLQLDTPFAENLDDGLRAEIIDSHCGLIPSDAADPMMLAQRLRDAVMAEQLVLNAGPDGAILIVGSGHVRNDRGVPWYLRKIAPGKMSVSVMLIEAKDDLNLRDMIPMNPDNNPATDYVWFTPRAERDDPCEVMRRQMQQKSNE